MDDTRNTFDFSEQTSNGLISILKEPLTSWVEKFSFDVTDVSKKNAKQISRLVSDDACRYLSEQNCGFVTVDFVFPEGSKIYKLLTVRLTDQYILCEDCFVRKFTDLNQMIASTKEGQIDTYIGLDGFGLVFTASSDSQGTVKFFNYSQISALGTASYSIQSLGGRKVLEIINPVGLPYAKELNIFVEKDGAVVYGTKRTKGSGDNNEVLLNKTALDELLKQLKFPSFTK